MFGKNYTTYHWIVFWGVIPIVSASTLTTGGSVAAIVSAIILFVGLISGWIRFHWLRSHPFKIMISLDDYHIPPGKKRRWADKNRANLCLGDNMLLIAVSPRSGTSWRRINIRMVKRRLSPCYDRIWEYYDSDKAEIEVTDFRDVVFDEEGAIFDRYFEYDTDGVGGYNGRYEPELPVMENELVWFKICIRANDIWDGFLSFEGALGNRRSWRRIRAEVVMPKVVDEKGKKRLTKKQFHKLLDKASQPIKKSEKEYSGKKAMCY